MITPRHERITTVVERYVIDSPATGKDVYDVLWSIEQVLKHQQRTVYDDSIAVIARDDEIHFEISHGGFTKSDDER